MTTTSTALMSTLPGEVTICSYTPPLSMTIEQARVVAERFGNAHRFTPWGIGDLLLFARNHLGEEYAQLLESFPYQEAYCYSCLRVAEAYAPNQRHPELSFSHHMALQRMGHVEREAWLTLAESNEWSVAYLKEQVQKAHHQTVGQEEPDLPSPPPEADHLLAHAENALATLSNWTESEIVAYPQKGNYRVTVRVEIEPLIAIGESTNG